MNLLEHHILHVISEEDCTDEYVKVIGRTPEYPCIKVTAEVDCYGSLETQTTYWLLPEWKRVKKRGFYMG